MVPSALCEAENAINFGKVQNKPVRTRPGDPELVPTLQIRCRVNVFFRVTLQRKTFQ